MFDFSVHVGDMLVAAAMFGGVYLKGKGWVTTVDQSLANTARTLSSIQDKQEHIDTGLRNHDKELRDHRDWLVGAGLDQRTGHDRRHDTR